MHCTRDALQGWVINIIKRQNENIKLCKKNLEKGNEIKNYN